MTAIITTGPYPQEVSCSLNFCYQSVNSAVNSLPPSNPLAGQGAASATTGVVVIGRNEGERLRRCLESLGALRATSIYVDSGSTDGSIALARDYGVAVVNLEMSEPFTAARARNAGFRKLLQIHPSLDYLFFVDGDCEVIPGWVDRAVEFLGQSPEVAVVFGYRRERYPFASVYNRICDLEWQDIPVGEAKTCGGDIVARVAAIKQVDGYRPDMICGEEPEMCVRLRQQRWRIWRIDTNMTLHDAAMDRFGQWWKRMMRGGFGYAQGAHIHGMSPERHWVSEYRRIWMWGAADPLRNRDIEHGLRLEDADPVRHLPAADGKTRPQRSTLDGGKTGAGPSSSCWASSRRCSDRRSSCAIGSCACSRD
ncbi:MAG: glycosyltransferase family A protein [Steroidobacteraceae bacterium]